MSMYASRASGHCPAQAESLGDIQRGLSAQIGREVSSASRRVAQQLIRPANALQIARGEPFDVSANAGELDPLVQRVDFRRRDGGLIASSLAAMGERDSLHRHRALRHRAGGWRPAGENFVRWEACSHGEGWPRRLGDIRAESPMRGRGSIVEIVTIDASLARWLAAYSFLASQGFRPSSSICSGNALALAAS